MKYRLDYVLNRVTPRFSEGRIFAGGKRPPSFSPSHILDHFDGIESPFTNVLRHLRTDSVVLECESVLQSIVEATVLSAERKAVDEVISKTEMKTYHALQVTGSYPKLKVSPRQHYQEMTSQESTFFEKNIVCSSTLNLCMDTLQQSKCAR